VVVDRSPGNVVGPAGRTGDTVPQPTCTSGQLVLAWSGTGRLAADAQTPVPLA
jgi:hypothetical protein